jgi:hypothetical protein
MATNIIITRATAQVAESAAHPSWESWTAVATGAAVAVVLFKPFFKDWSGFRECLVYCLKPDWISWFQGEGVEDWWSELKMFVWMAIAVVSGVLAYHQLPKWLSSLLGA